MADPSEKFIDDLIRASSSVDKLKGEFISQYKEMKKNDTLLLKFTKDYKDQIKVLKSLRTEITLKTKEDKKAREALDKLNKSIERDTAGIKQFTETIGKVTPAFKGVMASAGRLAGSIGTVGFAFNDLVDVSFKYTKAIFNISRLQRISGQSADSLSSALKYVSQNTAMAQMEFLELADTMQNTFIGVKPSAMEMAKVIGTIGEQFGYDYKKAQKFAEIQAQFPQLSNKIKQGLESIRKINEGIGTADDEKKVRLAREYGLALSQAGEMGSQANDYIMQSLTPLSAAEKKQNEYLASRAKVVKEISDLQLELSKELQPIIKLGLDLAKKMVEKFKDFKEVIALVGLTTVGIQGLTKGVIALKQASFLIGGPWVRIAALIVGAAAAVGAFAANQRKAKEAVEKQRQESEKQAAIQNDLARLSSDQKKKYQEIADQRKKENKSSQDILEEHVLINKEVTQEENNIDKIYKNYEEVRKSADMQLQILGNINEALRTAVSTEEEFGGRAEEASRALVGIAEQQAKTAGTALRASVEGAVKMLESRGIDLKIDLGGDMSSQYESLVKASEQIKSMKMEEKDRESIIASISKAMKDSIDYRQKETDIVRNTVALQEINVRQQEKFTSAYEARLDAERKLMESAQFGMGASVEMMKEQVELAYKLMQTYADMDKSWSDRLVKEGKATQQDISRLKNAKTQAEAEEYIQKVMKARGPVAQELNNYAFKHQEVTKKIMDQQQKIYDLTKDIREGYLDAIREMSTGAGEFEKIIGTQEMGVTQLMDAVKDVTGVAKLNTMALGGLQERVLTASGVGTQVAGKYGPGGVEFIGGKQQEDRNNRIYKYGETRAQAEAVMRGEVPQNKSTVGTGVVPGAENYLAPERLEESSYDGTYKGVKDGMREAFSGGGFANRQFTSQRLGVNVGVTGFSGVPGKENANRIMANGVNSGNMGAEYLGGSRSPVRASGGYVYGVPGNKLNVASRESTAPASSEMDLKFSEDERRIYNKKRMAIRGESSEKWRYNERTKTPEYVSVSEYTEQSVKLQKYAELKEKVKKQIEDLEKEGRPEEFRATEVYDVPIPFVKVKNARAQRNYDEALQFLKDQLVANEKLTEVAKKVVSESNKAEADLAAETKSNKTLNIDYAKKREESIGLVGESAVKKAEMQVDLPKYRRERDEAKQQALNFLKEKGTDPTWRAILAKNLKEADAKFREAGGYGDQTTVGTKDERTEEEFVPLARQYVGKYGTNLKGKTNKAKAKEISAKITQAGLQGHVEQLSEEEFEKQKKARERAAETVRSGIKEKKSAMGSIATVEEERKGYTSAAQKEGMESSAEVQAAFAGKQAEMSAMYGSSGEGGAGVATIRLILPKGFEASVENANNVAVEIQNAV